MMTIDELLRELDDEGRNTRRVLERVPNNRLKWQPHYKSLTLGQLAMHVATLPGALAELLTRPFDVNFVIPRPGAASVDELLAVHDASLDKATRILSSMDDDSLCEPWTMVDGDEVVASIPRGSFLRSNLFNHWYHHRGQLTVYLRQTDALVPAIYGDSADEKVVGAR
jgi:uncharacterized damage-inducible protein DinB